MRHRNRVGRNRCAGTCCAAVVLLVVSFLVAVAFPRAAFADETVTACGPEPNLVFQHDTAYQFSLADQCPGGSLEIATQAGWNSQGQGAIWQADAPANMVIVGASVHLLAVGGATGAVPVQPDPVLIVEQLKRSELEGLFHEFLVVAKAHDVTITQDQPHGSVPGRSKLRINHG